MVQKCSPVVHYKFYFNVSVLGCVAHRNSFSGCGEQQVSLSSTRFQSKAAPQPCQDLPGAHPCPATAPTSLADSHSTDGKDFFFPPPTQRKNKPMNLPQERNEQQVNQSPEGAMKWRANTCLCCFPTWEQLRRTPVKY